MLPQGYTQVEYIESTGTQYIDARFKPNQNSRIIMDCLLTSTPTSNAALFGARNGSSAEFWTLYRASSSKFAFRYGGSGTNHFVAGAATERHRFDFDKNTMTVDDAAVTVTSATFSSAYSAYLFAVNDAGGVQYPASMRLYRCQIYGNGTLVRDFIPCRNPDGEAGLYDMVGGQFYGNDGTGEFVCGRAVAFPEHYKRLAYIESTGTQYINTRYKPNNNTRLVMDCTIENPVSSNYITLFGARDADLARCFALFVSPSNNFYPNIGIKTDYYTYPTSISVVGHHVIDANKNTITIDESSHTFTARTFQNSTELFIFANNENNSTTFYGAFKVGAVKIYDNGTLVRDYIPCQTDTGEVGLYDMATATFYENNGTGEFIAGHEVAVLDDPNTLLLLHGEDLTDVSQYAQVLTSSGVTVSDVQSKFGGKSLYFNGSAYLRLADIDILPDNGDFTVDWWEYRTASSEGSVVFHQPVKAKDGTGTIFGYGYSGQVNAYIGNTSGSFNIVPQTSMGAEVLNQWVHRAAVRSGNRFLLFANGVLQNTVTSSAALARNITPYIGRYDSGSYLYYKGYLDELRISDVARWTTDFVPPDEPYGTPETAPDAPESLEYTQAGGVVSLTWSASSGAETYRVYRDGSLIVETESTEYTDTVMESPVAHVYAVTAANEFGESDFSEIVRAEYWGDIAPELIYDRVQADVDDAKALISKYMRGETLDGYEQGLWDKGLRGCYNTSDTNRVEYHTRELQSILNTNGYNIHIDTRLWAKSDIMRYSDIVRYLGNIKTILDAFGRSANAPELPSIDAWIDYVVANDIEKILYVTRELIYGALAMFRRAGTFTAGNDYVTQVIRRA